MTYCLELRKRKTILLNHCQKGCGSGHIKVFCLYLRKARIQRSFFQRSDPDFSSSIYQKEKKSNFQFFLLKYIFILRSDPVFLYDQIRFFRETDQDNFHPNLQQTEESPNGIVFLKNKIIEKKKLGPPFVGRTALFH